MTVLAVLAAVALGVGLCWGSAPGAEAGRAQAWARYEADEARRERAEVRR